MVGMLQIITYLLCVYLIFKAVEILQLGFMGFKDNRKLGVVVGVLMLAVSLYAAWYFKRTIDFQAAIVGATSGR